MPETYDTAPAAPEAAHPASPTPLSAIFFVFLRIGLFSFGGGLSAWIFREVVLDRQWLTREEFFSSVALSQILPGTNVSNLTVFTGQRLRGLPGASVALAGLLVGPFFAVLAIFFAYGMVARSPLAQKALEGIAAAAVGLLLLMAGEGAKIASRHVTTLLAFLGTFVAVGVLEWPMVPVVIGVGILSVIASAIRRRA